jgi:hypothetical protein
MVIVFLGVMPVVGLNRKSAPLTLTSHDTRWILQPANHARAYRRSEDRAVAVRAQLGHWAADHILIWVTEGG